jgi:hypothetical protein
MLPASPAAAWHSEGHRRVAADAARGLSRDVPSFFRAGALAIGHSAVDPDSWKLREAPELRDRESPEHYLDTELLGGRELPPLRSQYLALLAEIDVPGSQVGYLPYTIVEATQRLTIAFAEHRRWPRNRHVRAKTLVYAGWLAHYAADLCQPLHTTIHHDGRALPDLTSPRSGIHDRVDGLFESVPIDRHAAVRGMEPVRFEALGPAVGDQLGASHALVSRVYELDDSPAVDGTIPPEVAAFARDRYQTAVWLVASLYWTAWSDSADLDLPAWLDRREY